MKLGIDFGTCYSFPAAIVNGECRSLLSMKANNGNRGMPSVFYFDRRNGEMVGIKAEAYGNRKPDCCVRNVKRDIATGQYDLDGVKYSAVQICSKILARIVNEANAQLETEYREHPVYEAVLAVPVRFGDTERTLLRQAAEIPRLDGGPGLTIKNFIQEPVAAAIDYSESIDAADKVLVYDLGGGTFDIALIIPTPYETQPYRVVDFDGTEVGGKDFDEKFAEYLATVFQREHGIDMMRDSRTYSELLKAACKAKEDLSDELRTDVELQYDGLFYDVIVKREEFEQVTRPILEKTLVLTQALAERNGLMKDRHLHIVMVGGSSYMPQVKKGMLEVFGEATEIHLHRPDKAIAFGAARFAENDNLVLQLAPFSYGTNTYRGDNEVIANMVFGKTPLPTPVIKHEFETLEDGQTSVAFCVYQNDSTEDYCDISKGDPLMEISLEFSAPVPAGTPVYVEMSLEDDGTLLIKAVDPATNKYETGSINIVRMEAAKEVAKAEREEQRIAEQAESLTYFTDEEGNVVQNEEKAAAVAAKAEEAKAAAEAAKAEFEASGKKDGMKKINSVADDDDDSKYRSVTGGGSFSARMSAAPAPAPAPAPTPEPAPAPEEKQVMYRPVNSLRVDGSQAEGIYRQEPGSAQKAEQILAEREKAERAAVEDAKMKAEAAKLEAKRVAAAEQLQPDLPDEGYDTDQDDNFGSINNRGYNAPQQDAFRPMSGQGMQNGYGQPMNGGYPQQNGYGQPMNGGYPQQNGYGQPMNGGYQQDAFRPMTGQGAQRPMNNGYGQPMNGGYQQEDAFRPMTGQGAQRPMNNNYGAQQYNEQDAFRPMSGYGAARPMNMGNVQAPNRIVSQVPRSSNDGGYEDDNN